MRILFFSHYYPPESNAPASRVHEMCKRWAKSGHTVHVITSAPNAPNGVLFSGYTNRLTQTEVIDGVHVTRVWTFLAANEGVTRRLANYLSYMVSAVTRSLFVDHPDIIIATSPQIFCGFAGWVSSVVLRVPFVIECRDLFADGISALTTASDTTTIIRLIRKIEFFLYQRGRRLVTVGEGYRQKLLEGGVAKEHISIIPNGVDRAFFNPAVDGTQVRRGFAPPDSYVVTYAGTIGMAHGLEVVLDAAEMLESMKNNNVVFVLAGDGAERRKLEQYALARGVRTVRFLGKLSKSAMPSLLAASDCCLVHLRKVPLFESVMPSKIFEMAHMRKPIILGVAGNAADFITSAKCGICIDPGNAKELVAAVNQLRGNPALAFEMGKAGWEHVGRHYSRERLAEDYLALLGSILRNRTGQQVGSVG